MVLTSLALVLASGTSAWGASGSSNATESEKVLSVKTDFSSPAQGVQKTAKLADGSTVVYGWAPKSNTVHPDSASGCNQEVCIDVQGSGLYVDQWNTTAYGNVGCSYAVYLRNGNYIRITDDICPTSSGDGVYYYDWAYPIGGKFGNKDKVCNTWYYLPGKPCETIHS